MLIALFFISGLLILLFFGLHVASAIVLLAVGADLIVGNGILIDSLGSIAWDRMNEFSLVAIPLFVLLGEILLR
mgnify:FL=1